MLFTTSPQFVPSNVIHVKFDTSLFDLINQDEIQTESLFINLKQILSLRPDGHENPELEDKNGSLRIIGIGNGFECSLFPYKWYVSKDRLVQNSSDTTGLEQINVNSYAIFQHVIPFVQQCVKRNIGCYISRESLSEVSDDNGILCYLMSADNSSKLHAFTKTRFITHAFSISAVLNKYFLKRNKQTYRQWNYWSPEALQLLISDYSKE